MERGTVRTRKLAGFTFVIAVVLWTQAFTCSKHQVVATEHDFLIAVTAAQNVEIAEFQAGNVPPDLHKQIQGGFLKTSQIGEQVAKLLAANASNQTVLAQLTQVVASLQVLLDEGNLGIKNAATLAAYKASVQAAIDIVKNLATALGGTA